MAHFVVIGAGQAGASLVARLRRDGFDGDITLIGSEPFLPYQRPPLSKAYLLGDMETERLYLRPLRFYTEHNIKLILGQGVSEIDKDARTLTIAGMQLGYDQLVLATGSVPNRLPGAIGGDLGGVHVVRTLADVDGMAPGVTRNARALIVGGGYIGLEAAAVAAGKGVRVTLVEMSPRILQRVAAPQTSDYFRALHRRHGVDIREATGLQRLIGTDGRVSGAVLSDGSELAVDLAVVGVGVSPATALAGAAGLTLNNGIAVDAMGRTSDPFIWAAGDCTSFPHQGGRIRLESVPHAIDQAENVAVNMLGCETPYVAKPWFWSDQYDVKLQIAGLSTGYTRVVARRGTGQSASFWYYRDDTLLAVDAMNDPRAYMIGKRLIEAGKSPDADLVADPSGDLKGQLRG